MDGRIDFHQHIIPPFWLESLGRAAAFHGGLRWSPETAIGFMDSRGIATGILSLGAPSLEHVAPADRPSFARKVNEYTADLVAKKSSRFGNFATVPLPDVDAALAETVYALDIIGAQGIVVLSNYGDLFLGDSHFFPFWEELDRREALVFVHPTYLNISDLPAIPPPFVDFLFATTRTALQLVLSGVLDRCRKVKIILSHGGGFVPYGVHRFVSCATAHANGLTAGAEDRLAPDAPELPYPADETALTEIFRRFYFDTALTCSPSALAALKIFADPSHILFGSDFPYVPRGVHETYTSVLDSSPQLMNAERSAINRDNARVLLAT